MTGMILTAKHHDGMALWDTATTQYKIANGTWAQNRVTQGLDANVVRMAAESAKKFGLKFGVYLSPWDMHRDPAVAKAHLNGTIYDEPQIFGDATPGDYNDLYAQQLTELVTMQLSDGSPIELFEVWLDGASGSSTVQTFDWTRFRDIIRTHQPNAVMWGHQGVDARWVGNEDGVTVADQLAHDQPHPGSNALQRHPAADGRARRLVLDACRGRRPVAERLVLSCERGSEVGRRADGDVPAVGRPERESAARRAAGRDGQDRAGRHRRADGIQDSSATRF